MSTPATEQILTAYAGDVSDVYKRWEILEGLGLDKHSSDDTLLGTELVYCGQHLGVHGTGWCTVGIDDKLPLAATERQEAIAEARTRGLRFDGDAHHCRRCEADLDRNAAAGYCTAAKGKFVRHDLVRNPF